MILTPQLKQLLGIEANNLVNNEDVCNRLDYLSERWKDESQYEDIEEYKKNFQQVVPQRWVVMKATKRPFGFHLKRDDIQGFTAWIQIRSRGSKNEISVSWKQD